MVKMVNFMLCVFYYQNKEQMQGVQFKTRRPPDDDKDSSRRVIVVGN